MREWTYVEAWNKSKSWLHHIISSTYGISNEITTWIISHEILNPNCRHTNAYDSYAPSKSNVTDWALMTTWFDAYGSSAPSKYNVTNPPLMITWFDEFRSELNETNKIFKVEIMKALEAMIKQMSCLIKNTRILTLGFCEATFYPFTPSFMRWLYLKIHMLLVKEKWKCIFSC